LNLASKNWFTVLIEFFFGVVGWCKKPTGKVTPMCRKVALPFAPLLVLNVCASWETFLNLKNTFDWWIPGARSQRSAGGTCQDALRVFCATPP